MNGNLTASLPFSAYLKYDFILWFVVEFSFRIDRNGLHMKAGVRQQEEK